MFSVFEIIVFEHFAIIFHSYDEKKCDLHSTCYQTVLRLWFWLRIMFSNSICPRLMENWDESVLVEVLAVFGTREHVYWRSVF